MSIYFNNSGAAKKLKKIYRNIDGVAKEVKKIYRNVDGVAKLVYTSISGYAVLDNIRLVVEDMTGTGTMLESFPQDGGAQVANGNTVGSSAFGQSMVSRQYVTAGLALEQIGSNYGLSIESQFLQDDQYNAGDYDSNIPANSNIYGITNNNNNTTIQNDEELGFYWNYRVFRWDENTGYYMVENTIDMLSSEFPLEDYDVVLFFYVDGPVDYMEGAAPSMISYFNSNYYPS